MSFFRFYFTFGSNECYPYKHGYVLVLAYNLNSAIRIFKEYHPHPQNPDIVNCAAYYTADEFFKNFMQKNGSYKGECHEVISPHAPAKTRLRSAYTDDN